MAAECAVQSAFRITVLESGHRHRGLPAHNRRDKHMNAPPSSAPLYAGPRRLHLGPRFRQRHQHPPVRLAGILPGGEQTGWRNRIGVHQEGRPQQCHRASERQPQTSLPSEQEGRRNSGDHVPAGRNNAAGLAQFGSRQSGHDRPGRQTATSPPASRSPELRRLRLAVGQRQRRGLRPDLQLNEALGERFRPHPPGCPSRGETR